MSHITFTIGYLLTGLVDVDRAPNSSSETRLVVSEKAGKRVYDSKKYENQMYRFNNIDRANCYEHDFGDLKGLDHCYDCRGEVHVFSQYIIKRSNFDVLYKRKEQKPTAETKSIRDYVNELNEHLNAREKMIRLVYNNKSYETRFTEINYGKKFEEVCRESVASGYRKWSRPTNLTNVISANVGRIDPARLNFSANHNEAKRLGTYKPRPYDHRKSQYPKYPRSNAK